MLDSRFQIIHRFQAFLKEIDRKELANPRSISIFIGWLLTANFLLFSLNQQESWVILWIFINGYFWIHLNRIIFNSVKPLMELLLTIALVFISLDIFLVRLTLAQTGNVFIHILHSILISFVLLPLSLVLISNSQKSNSKNPSKSKIKQGVLLRYAFLGYIGHIVVFYDHVYFLYLFQILLFIALLKKTQWLEILSKAELWFYFFIFIIVLSVLPDNSVFRNIPNIENIQKAFWISIPFYFYLLLKMYLLALAVKIPIVMIYNHASLSRKLWISGLFQSTFPQLIQFLVLVFGFYFFIASWQADQLRSVLNQEIQKVVDNKPSPDMTHYQFNKNSGNSVIAISGYQAVELTHRTNFGILEILKKNVMPDSTNYADYFLYINPKDTSNDYYYLVQIDTSLTKILTRQLTLIVHSGLMAYPFSLKDWQQSVYNLKFWQNPESIKIFPFSLLSNNKGYTIETALRNYDNSEKSFNLDNQIYTDSAIRYPAVGRLYFPVLNATEENVYFAIDIFFVPDYSFLTSFIAKIILALVVLSFLFNFFITRRVVKFGNEIHHMIVQKFNHLKNGIREISSGNLNYKVQLEGDDEFVEFANRFNQMGDRLQKTISDLREKDRLDQELQIARNVQLSLLPAKIPDVSGFNVAASIETAVEVGGDLYDFFELGKNEYLFTIGDVSGKGSSAAFYMAQFISLLRYSVQFTSKPDEIAVRLNNYFTSHVTDRQIFITAIIGVLNVKNNSMNYIRAGHNLPIFMPGNPEQEIKEIHSDGLGFGLTKDKFKKSLKLEKITLATGDMILLYTDGVCEATRPDSENNMNVFGEEKLFKILSSSRNLSAADLTDKIKNELIRFYGGHASIDDQTILIIQKI